MATSNANWFGNLINAFLFMFLNSFVAALGWFMVLFGSPEFYGKTMESFGLYPAGVEAEYLYFN